MLKDYYTTLTRVRVTRTLDSGGSYTETTQEDTIKGYFALLTSTEQYTSNQLGLGATARLFTDVVLFATDRIIREGETYEVVGVYNFFHRYYDLRKIS